MSNTTSLVRGSFQMIETPFNVNILIYIDENTSEFLCSQSSCIQLLTWIFHWSTASSEYFKSSHNVTQKVISQRFSPSNRMTFKLFQTEQHFRNAESHRRIRINTFSDQFLPWFRAEVWNVDPSVGCCCCCCCCNRWSVVWSWWMSASRPIITTQHSKRINVSSLVKSLPLNHFRW